MAIRERKSKLVALASASEFLMATVVVLARATGRTPEEIQKTHELTPEKYARLGAVWMSVVDGDEEGIMRTRRPLNELLPKVLAKHFVEL